MTVYTWCLRIRGGFIYKKNDRKIEFKHYFLDGQWSERKMMYQEFAAAGRVGEQILKDRFISDNSADPTPKRSRSNLI